MRCSTKLRELDSIEKRYKDLFQGRDGFSWFNQFVIFEEFIDIRKDTGLYEILEWFEEVCAKNQGLYFSP